MAASIEFFLHNFLGIASWRWLYIIEASCTIILAISAMFILPDYPNTTKFLSPEERTLAITRLQTGSPTKMTRKSNLLTGLKLALLDYKVWLLAYVPDLCPPLNPTDESSLIIITKTSASAVTSFIPTLIATLSTYRVTTLLLIAPPYIFAAVLSLGVSRISDRLGERAYHIVGPMVFAICGFGVAAVTMISAAKYLSLFAMLGGVYGSYNVALAWISSTVCLMLTYLPCFIDILIGTGIISRRKTLSGDSNHQHGRQRCTNILTLLLLASEWASLSVCNGGEYVLLWCLYCCHVVSEEVSEERKPRAGEGASIR